MRLRYRSPGRCAVCGVRRTTRWWPAPGAARSVVCNGCWEDHVATQVVELGGEQLATGEVQLVFGW
jgi:hypothetical protein